MGAFGEAESALDAAEAGLLAHSQEAGLKWALREFDRRPILPASVIGWWQAFDEIQDHLAAGRPDLAAERVRDLQLRRLQTLRALLARASVDQVADWGAVREQVASLLVLGFAERAAERLCDGLDKALRPPVSQHGEVLHLARAIAARLDPARLPNLLDRVIGLYGGGRKRDFLLLVRRILLRDAPWTALTASEPPRSDSIQALAATVLAQAGCPEPAIALFGGLLDAPKPPVAVRRELVFCSGIESTRRIWLRPRPRPGPPMIFDLFPYNGEIETLKIKLHEMAPWVDRFVIVEAAETFSGKPKPIHLPGQAGEIAEFMPKIIHVVAPGFPAFATSAWAREYHQRDQAVAALQGVCAPDDLVLLSDTDEVVDVRAIEGFDGEFSVLKTDLYKYFLNYRRTDGSISGSGNLILMRARRLAHHSPSAARALLNTPLKPNRIEQAGWHFTSVGDEAAIARKLDSYAHRENDQSDSEAHYGELIARIRAGGVQPGWEQRPLEALPAYVLQNRERLAPLIL